MQLTDTIADAAAELAQLAGVDLDDRQAADLRELLHLGKTGTWRWPEWTVRHPRSNEDLIAIRVLAGFLFLDERVLWSAHTHLAARVAHRRIEALLHKLGQPGEGRTLDVSGIPVKVRYANGEEQIERLDTGAGILFLTRRFPGAGRGLCVDLHVVDQASQCTLEQHARLLPCMASRPNPQIIYT